MYLRGGARVLSGRASAHRGCSSRFYSGTPDPLTTTGTRSRLDAPGLRPTPDVSPQERAEAILRAATQGTTGLTVRVPMPVYDAVYRVAADRGVTMSAVMRAAIRLFLRNLGHAVESEHFRPVPGTLTSRRSL